MTSYTRSRYLRNPITGECREATPTEARHLRSYEWTYINLAQYKAWQVGKWTQHLRFARTLAEANSYLTRH